MNFDIIDKLASLSDIPIVDLLEQLQEFNYGLDDKRNYYRFLYQMIVHFKPKVSLEIGIERGLGLAYMCMAANTYGGKVIGIDPCAKYLKYVKENFTFIHSDYQHAENEFAAIVKKGDLGLVFHQSYHYNASCKEWNIYSKYLSKDAIWICDDITSSFYNTDVDPPRKGMVEYFNALPGNKKLYKDVLHHGSTIGVVLC